MSLLVSSMDLLLVDGVVLRVLRGMARWMVLFSSVTPMVVVKGQVFYWGFLGDLLVDGISEVEVS